VALWAWAYTYKCVRERVGVWMCGVDGQKGDGVKTRIDDFIVG